MKTFTPTKARRKGSLTDLYKEKVTLAYRQLISENIDNPCIGEAQFTQGTLIGRCQILGLRLEGIDIVEKGLLNQEPQFNRCWEIFTHPGFYTTVNSHALIRFTQKSRIK